MTHLLHVLLALAIASSASAYSLMPFPSATFGLVPAEAHADFTILTEVRAYREFGDDS